MLSREEEKGSRESLFVNVADLSKQRTLDTAGIVVKVTTKAMANEAGKENKRGVGRDGMGAEFERRSIKVAEVANERRLRCIHLASLLMHTVLSDHTQSLATTSQGEQLHAVVEAMWPGSDGGASRLARKGIACGELPSGENGGT